MKTRVSLRYSVSHCRLPIPNDTFSNYLLHSLTVIYFGHVSKTLFKIPHLLDPQKFPNLPNYWDFRSLALESM